MPLDLFGAPKIDYKDITSLERSSPDIIMYALPAVAFFTLLEIGISWYTERKNYDTRETLGSLFIGIGNLVINLALKVSLIYGAVWIYNLVPWRMAFNWWTLIPCLLIYDISSYWAHRVSHFQRFFWATHVVHHSGEHYNLTVSFRQSWVQHFKIVFFLPLAFAGFHPVIFFIANQIGVLYQFWVHTEYIGKLHPAFEYVFATPSHHRVHHGSQDKYLDRNFGVILIVWDRLFGTFTPEEERPDYGLTTKVGARLDPVYLNFHEYRDIWNDVRSAQGWRKKFYYLFGKPAQIAREKKALEQAPAQETGGN